MLHRSIALWSAITDRLAWLGPAVSLLALRLILAWEYGQAGFEKLHGNNWFAQVQDSFPFPFSVVPAEISWFMATWAEILAAFALALGLLTRFWAISLLILTTVAIAAVHWPADWNSLAELWRGYAISDKGHGNFKLPLLFMLMLLPLLFVGAGRFSLDAWLRQRLVGRRMVPIADPAAGALVMAALGVPLLFVLPKTGWVLLLAALGLLGWQWLRGETSLQAHDETGG